MSDLITKYRPKTFYDVFGHDAIVRALDEICTKKDTHAFLFSGPYGIGKTTLARLVAKAYGCEDTQSAILELDAATFTGIDSMRAVQELLHYRPFDGSGQRAIILDEAHGLSKQAFDSILKALEEPPPGVVWCLCTTNPTKIPKTLRSRCAEFDLKPLDDKLLGELLDYVCDHEALDLPEDVAAIAIREAKGSPRQLLSNVVVVRTARTREDAAELLKTTVETNAAIELARVIVAGGASWRSLMALLGKLENEPPDSVRIVVANYIVACLRGAKTDDAAAKLFAKLDAFSSPLGVVPHVDLMLAIGRSVFT